VPWASEEILPGGGQRQHFACTFQVADDAVQMDVHKTLYCFYHTNKMPHVTTRVTEMPFFGSNSQAYYDNPVGYLQIFKAGSFFQSSLANVYK